MSQLSTLLRQIDGRSFKGYDVLLGQRYKHSDFQIEFIHVQGSPGAYPATVVHLHIHSDAMPLPARALASKARKLATADFLVRAFATAVQHHTRPNRGVQGSGSFQTVTLPPQVVERNLVKFHPGTTRMAVHISLPGSAANQVLGNQADEMLSREIPDIVRALALAVGHPASLPMHCDRVEDMLTLQHRLSDYGLVAFVADGARLPRLSGASQKPMGRCAQEFKSPHELAVDVRLPNAGRIRGLGIRNGVNVIVGGGFHGKSTLLNALAKAVYPHIPNDGREQVVCHPESAYICSEEGRAATGVDITGFLAGLPGGKDTGRFCTQNASGSTSQAAAIVEAVLAGARLLLMDEDTSATNLLIRDDRMRQLVPEDPITPFLDRARELYDRYGVSSVIAVGSSSEYLKVADHVIAMRHFQPVSLTARARELIPAETYRPPSALRIRDERHLQQDNFDPSYTIKRLNKRLAVRIKPLRLQNRVLEYGDQQLDLSRLKGLVDNLQVLTIGFALLHTRQRGIHEGLSPTELATVIDEFIAAEGLDALGQLHPNPLFLSRPRRLDLAGAINRLRNLNIDASKI